MDTPDPKQLEKVREAMEKKARDNAEQESLNERGRPQDVRSPRAKSSGHGKKTADKWNQ